MEPLRIVCWKWSDPRWPHAYTAEHVNVFADSVSRNLTIPHIVLCVTDDSKGISSKVGIIPLWEDYKEQGDCFLRLRAFSTEMKDVIGERFVSIDLDSAIVGDLTPLFAGSEDFRIAKDTQPGLVYNGSMFMVKTGARKQIWETFDPVLSKKRTVASGYNFSDQNWFATCLGKEEKIWDQKDGVYSYKNDLLKNHKGELPANARIVFFHGHPKPWHFAPPFVQPSWVSKHWRRNKRALLVLGGAACVWEQLKGIDTSQFDVMATNDMGYCYPDRIDYWVTLHPENLKGWKAKRSGNQDYETWSYAKICSEELNKILPDYWKSATGMSGSTGLFAAQVGLKLGYEYILLAGVPIDGTNNQTGPKQCWNSAVAESFRDAWTLHADKMRGKVFSMSGWTRDLLGYTDYTP